MTSTFSSNKSYELQATGDNANAWGDVLNDNVFSVIDKNLGGRLSLSVAGSADVTLSASQAQNVYYSFTGTLTGNISVIFPNAGGFYFVNNATSGSFTLGVKPSGGTAVIIPQGGTMIVFANPDTTSAFELAPVMTAVTLASAGTTNLGSTGSHLVIISGTNAITSFGSSANVARPFYFVRFTGALTLTHNGTSLILPKSANITTANGDTAMFEYLGSGNWRCHSYHPIAGVSNSVLANMANLTVKSNISGGSASPADNTLTDLFDNILGAGQGWLLYRDASAWTVLATGTSGQVLTTGGAAADPSWANPTAYKVGSFTRDQATASGTQAVTGVGFKPRAVVLIASTTSAVDYISIGFSDGSTNVAGWSNAGGTAGKFLTSAAACIGLQQTAANANSAVVSSLDSDGFTLTWTKASSPTGTATIMYIALR